ncbi:MAG: hypothetical protein K0S34_1005 [Bacillales bacterium]|jgi:hypothetical protein|nr:hypothetical protein [Bacillales bacterium]
MFNLTESAHTQILTELKKLDVEPLNVFVRVSMAVG